MVTPEEHRSLIDSVLDPSFLEHLGDVSPDELRGRLRDVRAEEDALSYIRRDLHGRMDLLRAELERRRAGEAPHDVDALVSVLQEHTSGANRGSHVGFGLRAAAVDGRRRAEQIVTEDHLARLPDMASDEIEDVVVRVVEAEGRLSEQRRRLHEVIDTLEAELAARYKSGLEPSLERLQ